MTDKKLKLFVNTNDDYDPIEDFFNYAGAFKKRPVPDAASSNSNRSVKTVIEKFIAPKKVVESKPPRRTEFKGTEYVKKYQTTIQKQEQQELTPMFSGLNITGLSTGLSLDQTDYSLNDTSFCESTAPSEISTDIEFGDHRRNLAIFNYREEIIATVKKNTIVMIIGPTGCGKSTQVAQYIYDDASRFSDNVNILISQPRKIAAITVAQRVAQERGEALGTVVGYQVGLDKCINVNEEPTQMTFCTTGIILQKLLKQKSLANYSHIILDEVHERDLEIDFLITIIRRLNLTNSNTKVILMSATLDVEKFQNYWKIKTNELENEFVYPPIIDIYQKVRRHEILERYLDDIRKIEIPPEIMDPKEPGISNEMYCFAFRLIMLILRSGIVHKPTILVFLPGLPEIERFQEEFHVNDNMSKLKQFEPEFHILHSSLSMDQQKKVFLNADRVKIILSTNIAESSITIPKVSYVIDFCLTKHLKSCKGSQISTYLLAWASKNNCKQRAGRTGRVSKGTVFRLVWKDFYFRNMLEHSVPEMLLAPLESVITKIKDFNMGAPLEILADSLDPPDESAVVNAVLCLKEHGGLLIHDKNKTFEYHDGEFTFLGEIMAGMPCDIRISKLIVFGYLFSVLDEAIIIAAGLNFKGIFLNTLNNRMEYYVCKTNWSSGTGSDCLATFYAYQKWYELYSRKYFKSPDEEREWCLENGLDVKNLHEMRVWIDEIKKRLKYFRIENLPYPNQPFWSQREKVLVLKIAMAGSFGIANFFTTETQIDMERDAFQMFCNFDTFSSVYCRGMDKMIIGDVYKQQMKDLLIEKGICDEESHVKFDFDKSSQRVNIMFEGGAPGDSAFASGNVAPEVYKAVKLRHLEGKLKLQVMTPQETINYAEERGYGMCEGSEFIARYERIKHPEHWPYPTRSTVKMKGIVTHMIHCNKFYFCPLEAYNTKENIPDNRYENALKTVKQYLKSFDMVPLKDADRSKIKRGKMVVYRNVDIKENERAEFIRQIDENIVEIRIIDRGMFVEAPIKYLYLVKNSIEAAKLESIPQRIFECRLKEIAPSTINSLGTKWSSNALSEFSNRVLGKKVEIAIYSIVANVVAVELTTIDAVKVNWNEKLVSLGFAEECEESYASKINHEARVRNYNILKKPSNPANEFADLVDDYYAKLHEMESPDKSKCNRVINLVGPYSPLETNLRAIAVDVSGYIRVDSSSINSVLLNDEILKLCDKFFIAADISIGAVNGNVKARETTEMPNIPGLACLLAMIFSPTAQLRRDKEKTRYISLITGLGLDEADGKSYFIERDAVQYVDFDLTDNDIADINRLRFTMSSMLHRDPFHKLPNLNDRQREQMLRNIKEILSTLINKKREIRDVQMGSDHFNWNVDQEDSILHKNRLGHGAIWNYIPIPPLHKMSQDEKSRLIRHVQQLENHTGVSNIRECKLCGKGVNSENELKLHLMSKLHLLRKQQLGIA